MSTLKQAQLAYDNQLPPEDEPEEEDIWLECDDYDGDDLLY